MVVTNAPEIAEKVNMLRNHGSKQKYYYLIPGFNSRLDELQAAILQVKLKHIEKWISERRRKAAFYVKLLRDVEGVETPYEAPWGFHMFNYYTITVRNGRGELQKSLASHGIATAVYYPLSLHLQEVYRSLGYKPGDFPWSEQAQEQVLSLPMYPELTEGQIEEITKVIKDFMLNELRSLHR